MNYLADVKPPDSSGRGPTRSSPGSEPMFPESWRRQTCILPRYADGLSAAVDEQACHAIAWIFNHLPKPGGNSLLAICRDNLEPARKVIENPCNCMTCLFV